MNGNAIKTIFALVGIIVGSMGAGGFMSCQYREIDARVTAHEMKNQEMEVSLSQRLARIEALLEQIRDKN